MELLGLNWQAWITIIVVLCMFASMSFTRIKAEVAFLTTISVLCVTGVLNAEEAFSGFSSESVIIVGVLFIVIAGLTYTGVLNWVVKNLMGTPSTLSGAIIRLMLPVAVLSSMLSNTTVVALFLNVVKIWSRKLGIAPSKLLIPLSYASGMGGICTLIGTPPNLIISGMYTEDTGIQLSILTPTICGLFCLAVGVLSMIAMQKFLPEREAPMNDGRTEDFMTEVKVPSNSPVIGMTVADAKEKIKWPFNDIKISFIHRFDDEIVTHVTEDEFIMGGDKIFFSGRAKSILEMSRLYGLKPMHLQGVLESEVDENVKPIKTLLSSLILLAMILLSAFNILPMLSCCLLAAIAVVVCHCCTSSQAMKAIDWKIIIVFAGSVAIGKAIEDTGLAEMVANGLLGICGKNPYVVLTAICFVGTFVTEFISNTAAGAIFYPIAMSAAVATGANPLTFCVALMIAVSSSFATPIGSPTHMLIYGPGGYRFTDFARVGLLMNIIILIANIFITTIIFPL